MQYNFKKLDSCERKFTNAIDKTMKLLSEYQHTLGILKTNDNTKEKIWTNFTLDYNIIFYIFIVLYNFTANKW